MTNQPDDPVIPLDQITINPFLGNLNLGPNIVIVPYDSGIGVNQQNEKGHTVRQLAYYSFNERQWYKNDGEQQLALVPLGVASKYTEEVPTMMVTIEHYAPTGENDGNLLR